MIMKPDFMGIFGIASAGPGGALLVSLPAVDDHGSSVGKLSLFSVHLSEEAQDATGLLGDSVIGPADVLVVPDGTTILRL